MQNQSPHYTFRMDSSPHKDITTPTYNAPDSARKQAPDRNNKVYSPIGLGSARQHSKRMWEYDWTLLIPETHKQSGSIF